MSERNMSFWKRLKCLKPVLRYVFFDIPEERRPTKECPWCGEQTYSDEKANYCVWCSKKLPDDFKQKPKDKKSEEQERIKDFLEYQTKLITREAKKRGFLIELDPDTEIGQTMLILGYRSCEMRDELRRLTRKIDELSETAAVLKRRLSDNGD